MKKTMIILTAALLAVGSVVAQNDVVMVGQMDSFGDPEPLTTVEAALVSSYVWRGQVYNNDAVFQPQVTVAQYGFSVNVWGNYDLGSSVNGTSSDFSEIDFSLAYTLPFDVNEVAVDVGIIGYHFPANGAGNTGSPSTTELYAKGTILSFQEYVIPSVTIYGDVDEAEGVYVLFDVVAPYEVSEYLLVEGGVSAGWGNTSYNDYYFGDPIGKAQDEGFNDYNFYANASYEIIENVTASANITFTFLEGGSIRDSADRIYESKQKFWGGVNIAYDF
jgi:outer membrane scaffolding protein for murein synthesis (MipA/OmpV family)